MTDPETDSPPRAIPRTWILVLAIAVISAVVFLPALPGGWIYDDHTLIAENPYIHSFHAWTRWFTTDFWQVNEEIVRFGNRMVYWRPLITTTYAFDWAIGGGSPLWFHVVNTLMQAGVGVLAYFTLLRWTGARIPAAVAAVLFAVHPTKAESVAWIAGRTDVLCMVFVFLATAGIARRLAKRRGGIPLEVIGTIGAYLCKEQAIVLAGFAAVEAWVAAGRPALTKVSIRPMIMTALPQMAIAVVYLGLRAKFLPVRSAAALPPPPIGHHAQAVLDSLGRFFELSVVPHDLSIQQALITFGPDHQPTHSLPYMIVGAVGLVAIVAASWLLRKRAPYVAIGLGFFLFTLAPTSNLVYTDMATLISERFLYLPFLGIAFAVGMWLARLPATRARVGYGVVAAVILALGVTSFRRSSHYSDESTFWARELEMHPHSLEARGYFLRSAMQKERYATALRLLLELQHNLESMGFGHGDVGIAYSVADTAAHLIPDSDVVGLRAIDSFLDEMLSTDAPTATLKLPFLTFMYTFKQPRKSKDVSFYRPRLQVLRARILSRLGDDTGAIEMAAAAEKLCDPCISVAPAYAVMLARAGKYTEAIAVLDRVEGRVHEKPIDNTREHIEKAFAAHAASLEATGPKAIQQRAIELSTLELWGRAYDVLAPHEAEITHAPNVAMGFAELALRAGHPDVARRVVAANLPANEVEAQLDEWRVNIGWKEPPP